MSVSEHANYLLNEYGRLQFDYAFLCKPDGESLRNEARNNLEEYIAELEAENIRLGIEYQRMRLALGDIAINSKRALKESPTDQLTARWRQERQDDKSSNDTQTDTFVYGKDSKPIPCPFCGEIVKECNDVATAELEAAQARWVMVSERLPNKSGWYRVGAIDVFYEGYTDEVYFYANKTDLGWKTCNRNEIYCWLDGVPELPQPPEVQE